MVGRILPEQQELKVGELTKKAQNKSYFFTSDTYKERVFVLTTCSLLYFTGTVKKRGELKGTITLTEVLAVETLEDKRSSCGFQVCYEEDGRSLILYVFARSTEIRDEWVSAVREEALKSGAYFILSYHPRCWDRRDGFDCCGAPSRGDEGCMPVTRQTAEMRERLFSKASSTNAGEILVDMMEKRSQGKSSFFGVVNFKERVFVLDVRSLRYFGGNLKRREGEKGSIELCTVLAVEHVTDSLLDNRKNAFQVVYEDDDDEQMTLVVVAKSGHKRQTWVQAIRDEAKKCGARFQSHYHPGVWLKGLGKYNCCQNIDRYSAGCQPVTLDLQSYNAPTTDGGVAGGEVKVGMLTKRALNRSSFTRSRSYKCRLFVLDSQALTFFDTKEKDKKRGEQKGSIPVSRMEVVAPLEQGALDQHSNAFQVMYFDEEDQHRYILYLVSSSEEERHEWLTAITTVVERAGVSLWPYYHTGVWNKWLGKYSCCGKLSINTEGCQPLPPLSSPSARPHSTSSSSSSSSSSPSIAV
ncbi:uncharacterized protein LOC143299213 [Babylonia areolata]|uniref:uncharacterized protein LOC143299213 n=1 Tax=Babylonia areolata TaxID=304850 RepID=UPI003FCEFEB4